MKTKLSLHASAADLNAALDNGSLTAMRKAVERFRADVQRARRLLNEPARGRTPAKRKRVPATP